MQARQAFFLVIFMLWQALGLSPVQARPSRDAKSESTEEVLPLQQVWEELAAKYGVRNLGDGLLSHNGTPYRMTLIDPFLSQLRSVLKNPSKAEAYMEIFSRTLRPHLPRAFEESMALKRWILNGIHSLGSPRVDPVRLMQRNPEIEQILTKYPDLKDKLGAFFAGIRSYLAKNKYPLDYSSKKRVLILTTSGSGGGHLHTAAALASAIKTIPGEYDVKVVDMKELSRSVDPLLIITGSMHSEDIYDLIYQRENDPARALAYWLILGQMEHYLPDRMLEVAEAEVAAYKPHVIFSTVHHYSELLSLAPTFDVPLAVVSTDYEIQEALLPYVPLLDPELVKIFTTTTDPIFFESLQAFSVEKPGLFSAQEKNTLSHFTVSKSLTWEGFSKEMPVFFPLGYPLRAEISPQLAQEKVDKLETSLGLKSGEPLVTITMGRQGVGSLREIVASFMNQEAIWKDPVHIAVLAGKNQELRQELAVKVRAVKNANLHFHILDNLDGEQMAALYLLSRLWISKPGGATTAELEQMGVPLLALPHPEWEEVNFRYRSKQKQADSEFDLAAVPAHVLKILQTGSLPKGEPGSPIDWQHQLEVGLQRLVEMGKRR